MVTLFNLFTGFLSIVAASNGKEDLAAWLIILSLVWDSLDGNIARMFNNPSTLGRELDSLADIVSFVVAPAFLMSRFMLEHLNAQMIVILFFYLGAGAYRLARFNVRPSLKNAFEGLPTPAAAVTLSMTVLSCLRNEWVHSSLFMPLAVVLVGVLSFLMVSKVHYPKLSAIPFAKWQSLLYLGIGSLALVGMFMNWETGLASACFVFVVISPIYSFSFFPSPEKI